MMMPCAAPVAHIQREVARHFCLRPADLLSDRRAQYVSRPRQIAYYLSRELTTFSLPRIANLFGGRDHTTIMHGISKVEKSIAESPEAAETISRLLAKLEAELAPQTTVDNHDLPTVSAPEAGA
jgi:chromosomal replication initiator protein